MFSGTTFLSIAAEKVSPPLNEGSYTQATAKAPIYLKRCQHKAWSGPRHHISSQEAWKTQPQTH